MTRHSYHERDYAFGQVMLTLRTSIGLTQAGLAARLGVSRRAAGEWETGSNYPKAEHLQHFLELCVQQHIFAPEREEEEIRALWKTAHQRVLLDESWLSALLTRPPAPSAPVVEAGAAAVVKASPMPVQLSPQAETPVAHAGAEPAASPRIDWVGAFDVSHFSGHTLALDTRRAFVRGAGRRLHHFLLRDAARRIPRFAGAAHHPVAGTLACPALPAGVRQPGYASGER